MILSICHGMGLMDRAFMDSGFAIVPGCEIDPDQRMLHSQLCGGATICHDINDLHVKPGEYTGIIGGPPCQSLTKLRAMRTPKFKNLAPEAQRIVDQAEPEWFLFENVAPLDIRGAVHTRMNAMHYAKPHQSRERWFTHSANLTPPTPVYSGSVDDLMAYSVVAGRIYGPKRGAVLQGYPAAAKLKAPCVILQKGLANAVHYEVAKAWALAIQQSFKDAA